MQAKKLVFVAGLVSAALVPAVFAAPSANVYGSPSNQQVGPIEALARQAWREDIAQIVAPSEGCYHASYPSIVWQQVACRTASANHVHPVPHYYLFGSPMTAGNGNDYTIQTGSNLITKAVGSFPTFSGETSEKSVGVAAYGDGGILGTNEYSLQMNTQFTSTTTACKNHSGCTVWQQAVYGTDYDVKGEGSVFWQDWLIGYGSSRCPSGFGSDGAGDCYKNSSLTQLADISPADLAGVTMTITVATGGNDVVTLAYNGDAYSASQSDSTLDIASVMNTLEYQIVGDAGGSEAEFNNGVSATVKVAVTDGSTSTPSCVADSGTTGESVNLNLGNCTALGGTSPSISFTESN
ncbi:hypothetical protein EO087_02625 [Dyella sp. M7H15-1]|uniref:hypothetical protein n=1 Tax=Dyella sp. M7H15-1 TaxID=2501295 RepID=UPI00100505D6|nr:hypothetical protein [Dyella sp. M7H15-1]QAU23021.1 hypothetical protein EO087_02625 [Dyella sp. M7H15-1]